MTQVSMRDLLQAGAHFAPDPVLEPQNGSVHFRGAQQDPHHQPRHTVRTFNDARYRTAWRKIKIRCVCGTKRAAGKIIEEHARRWHALQTSHRWLGGMLTNYKTIRSSIKRLRELEEQG